MEIDTNLNNNNNNIELDKLAFIDNNVINDHAIININGNYKINKQEEGITLTFLVNILNRVIKKTKENHKKTIIINIFLDNYQLKNISREFIITTSKLLITLYPDNLEQCNIINPPHVFKSILVIIKKMLGHKAQDRILLKRIPINKLS